VTRPRHVDRHAHPATSGTTFKPLAKKSALHDKWGKLALV
jgi:hypothetical protein